MSQKLDKWKKMRLQRHTGIHLCWESQKKMQITRCCDDDDDDEKESFLFQKKKKKTAEKLLSPLLWRYDCFSRLGVEHTAADTKKKLFRCGFYFGENSKEPEIGHTMYSINHHMTIDLKEKLLKLGIHRLPEDSLDVFFFFFYSIMEKKKRR